MRPCDCACAVRVSLSPKAVRLRQETIVDVVMLTVIGGFAS
jgi:hypothetical protein